VSGRVDKKAKTKIKKQPEKRVYDSPARQRQADETRSRIVSVAQRLLAESGFAGMTIPAVAKASGVAVPTVYAIFGSKKGIVSALLNQVLFGDAYHALVKTAREVTDPLERLAFAARIARQVYEAELPVEDLLRGAGMLAPELAAVEGGLSNQRYDAQAGLIDALQKGRLLRTGLGREVARDILWSLTSRDLYRMLVRDRKWTPDQYEAWLEETLVRELVRL